MTASPHQFGPDDAPDRAPGAASRPASSDALFEQVYAQLRRVAQERLAGERRDHTLVATALVHEVWLRLMAGDKPAWGGRAQFFAAAVEAMRRILIDHARRRGAVKRGTGPPTLRGVLDLASEENISEALILDDLILRLEKEDAQAAAVVRLRFYAGLSVEETAETTGLSTATVKRDWAFARTWLQDAWEGGDR